MSKSTIPYHGPGSDDPTPPASDIESLALGVLAGAAEQAHDDLEAISAAAAASHPITPTIPHVSPHVTSGHGLSASHED